MIKKIAWETFKNTGDINTYLELKQTENIEDEIERNHLNVENKNMEKSIIKTDYIEAKNFGEKEEL